MINIDEDYKQASARARLNAVANLIALALIRMRADGDASNDKTRGLANTSEPRVYDRTLAPKRRET